MQHDFLPLSPEKKAGKILAAASPDRLVACCCCLLLAAVKRMSSTDVTGLGFGPRLETSRCDAVQSNETCTPPSSILPARPTLTSSHTHTHALLLMLPCRAFASAWKRNPDRLTPALVGPPPWHNLADMLPHQGYRGRVLKNCHCAFQTPCQWAIPR